MEINGTAYIVRSADTPHAMRARGLGNTATAMERAGIKQRLIVQRPNGAALYEVMDYGSDNFSKPRKAA